MTKPTRSNLEAEIRFQLEQLTVRNAHHDFETLCRRHARARVCDRVLPATGPVADGGDQGRDFETFRSFKAPPGMYSFRGSDLPGRMHLVFACTTQKSGLKSKIKADIKSIMKGAIVPDHLYYYAVQDLSVSRRHDLQEWALKQHGVALDVFDGQALSTELATPSLFWIAVDHLGLPPSRAPIPRDEHAQWYADELDHWQSGRHVSLTTARYLQMRRAARHFLDEEDALQDIATWLAALRQFIEDDDQPDLAREAWYEYLVLNLRGKGTLVGLEGSIDEFRRVVLAEGSALDLRHLGVVLSYAFGAMPRGAILLEEDVFLQWRSSFREQLRGRLAQDPPAPEAALLRESLAGTHLLVASTEDAEAAIDSAIEEWLHVAELARTTPLFPIQSLSDRLTALTPYLAASSSFSQLTELIDRVVAKRAGNAAAAENARDRAMALFKAKMYAEAVDYLHEAKALWFAGETKRGTLLSMLMLAHCYDHLGCRLASKYYALAAARLAVEDGRSGDTNILPKALAIAAVNDFNEGWWLSHFGLARLYLGAHARYDVEPGNTDRHDSLCSIIASCGAFKCWADSHHPRLSEHITNTLSGTFLLEDADAFAETIAKPEAEGFQPIDLGKERSWKFDALGVRWRIYWTNDAQTTAVAEALAATLQLVVVDLARVDLEVVGATVEVRVTAWAQSEPGLFEGNEDQRWRFNVTPAEHSSTAMTELLVTAVVRMLSDVALTPSLLETLEQRFSAGLPEKALAVRSYPHLYLEFISEDWFGKHIGAFTEAGTSFEREPAPVDPVLQRRNGLSPRYSEFDIEDMLRQRYEAGANSTRATLPRLVKDEGFKEVIRDLRSDGWLGWQILAAISVTTASLATLRQDGSVRPPSRAAMERFIALTHEVEQRDPGFPPDAYGHEVLLQQLQTNMVSSLMRFGFQLHERRLHDFDSVRAFLGERFRFFEDDLPDLDVLRQHGL